MPTMNRIAASSSLFAIVALGVAGCGPDHPAASSAAAPPALTAAPHTTVRSLIDLGAFGGDHAFGFEINNRGEIAARRDIGPPNAPFSTRAIFWSPRTGALDLGTLGGASAETRALNNHGMVVGMAQKPGDDPFQRHPTLWTVAPGGITATEL